VGSVRLEFPNNGDLEMNLKKYGYEAMTKDTPNETQTVGNGSDSRTTTLNPDYDNHVKAAYGDNEPNPRAIE